MTENAKNPSQPLPIPQPTLYPINSWLEHAQAPLLRRLLSASQDVKKSILLSLGLPAEELLPATLMGSAAALVLRQDPFALQLGPPYAPLRTAIVGLMAERGVICTEHQVLLTSGAQQALDLMARLLLRKGSDVLLEEMTFPGIRQAIEPFNARISTVRSDPQTGIDLADLKCKLKTARPAFLYAIPQGHNPLGTNIPANNRSELIKIAQRHGLLILEDDTYGFLSLEGNTTKPLRAFDDDLIIYIGSFSKIFAPGLRLGWMVVPERFMEKLALLRDLAEINTSSFGQRVMAEILQTGGLQDHIKCLRSIYRQKRDAMCEALSMHLGEAAKWTVPESGFFVWVRFHDGVDLVKLFESTLRDEHTAFAPGIAFAGESGGVLHPCARLSFSYASKEDINLGIEGLARALQRVR